MVQLRFSQSLLVKHDTHALKMRNFTLLNNRHQHTSSSDTLKLRFSTPQKIKQQQDVCRLQYGSSVFAMTYLHRQDILHLQSSNDEHECVNRYLSRQELYQMHKANDRHTPIWGQG